MELTRLEKERERGWANTCRKIPYVIIIDKAAWFVRKPDHCPKYDNQLFNDSAQRLFVRMYLYRGASMWPRVEPNAVVGRSLSLSGKSSAAIVADDYDDVDDGNCQRRTCSAHVQGSLTGMIVRTRPTREQQSFQIDGYSCCPAINPTFGLRHSAWTGDREVVFLPAIDVIDYDALVVELVTIIPTKRKHAIYVDKIQTANRMRNHKQYY